MKSIRHKLLYIQLPICILPLLLFGLIIGNLYREGTIKRTSNSLRESSILIADRIETLLDSTENCSNYVTININKSIQEYYKNENEKSRLSIKARINNELNAAKLIFKEIDEIAYVDINGDILYSDVRLMENKAHIMNSELMELLAETSGESI